MRKIEDEETKENLITAATYLLDNGIELDEKNLIYYATPENYRSIKKEVKSLKKLRKDTNTEIIRFYTIINNN